jgi:hypothetical protein
MEWTDLITITLVIVALWTFIPRHIRAALRSGFAPAVVALSESVLSLASIGGKALTHVAYRGLLGVPIPPPVMVKWGEDEDDEPEPLSSSDFPLPAAEEPQTNRSLNLSELALNADEVAALQRMIDHNKTAAKPSKSSTIQAGFGVSRGGSTTYQRASMIYDALFGAPAPAVRYRQRTPEQDALRQQLGISKR